MPASPPRRVVGPTDCRPRVAVVQHSATCPPARVGSWLADEALDLDVFRCFAGDGLPEQDSSYDALVVLGGEMGAYDDATHPWLTGTKALLAASVAQEVPTLAICLGLQLLAVGCGGRVARSASGPQVGVRPVEPDPVAATDPLLGGLEPGAAAVHWNNDLVVETPPGATVLARSGGTVQALRLGPAAWGLQFHPEVEPDTLRRWAEADVTAGTLDAAVAQDRLSAAAAADAALVRTWSAVTRRFAALVRQRTSQPTGPRPTSRPSAPSRPGPHRRTGGAG